MPTVCDIQQFLSQLAPISLAESWDNVGLLLGDESQPIERIMTCLTVSQTTVQEAIRERCQMIVSHHPIPFRPINRITTNDPTGSLLWQLARHSIGVYSAHTAWDNAANGINQQIANLLKLRDVKPLKPAAARSELVGLGLGRYGMLATPASPHQVAEQLRVALKMNAVQVLGHARTAIERIGIVCGSGASLLELVASNQCDAMITGEATYHQMLEATHRNVSLILLGHHGSERFAMDRMALMIAEKFPNLTVWASRDEIDPAVGLLSS